MSVLWCKAKLKSVAYVLDDKRSQCGLCIARICNEYDIVRSESGMYELLRSQMDAHFKQTVSLDNEHWKIQLCLEFMDCIHNVPFCGLNKQGCSADYRIMMSCIQPWAH